MILFNLSYFKCLSRENKRLINLAVRFSAMLFPGAKVEKFFPVDTKDY